MEHILKQHFGNEYISRSIADLHLNREHATVFKLIGKNGSDPAIWNRIWNLLGSYAQSIFSSVSLLIRQIPWESLIQLDSIPNYLGSLLDVINRILVEPSGTIILRLANAFFVGVTRLWEFLSNFISGLNFTNLQYLISAFGSLLKEYGQRFVNSMKVLFNGFKSIVINVISLFINAITNLSDFSGSMVSSIMAIPTKGAETLHKKAVQTVLFAFIVCQDIMEVFSAGKRVAKDYIEKYVKQLGDMNKSVLSLLERYSPSNVISALLQNQKIQRLLTYIGSSRPVQILNQIFSFITSIITQVKETVNAYFINFLSRANVLLSDVLIRLFDNVPTLSEYYDLTKACEDLAQDSKTMPEDRVRLKEAVAYSKETQENMVKMTRQKYENALYRDKLDLFTEAVFSSGVLTSLYFDEDVPPEDVDRVCINRVGYTSSTFAGLLNSQANLMHARFAIADHPKYKVASSIPIGNSAAGLGKERAEVLVMINDINILIERLEVEIKEIREEDVNYQNQMDTVNDAMLELGKQLGTMTRDVYRERVSQIEYQKEKVEELAGIKRLQNEIDALVERRTALEEQIGLRKQAISRLKWPIIIVLNVAVFGWIGYTIWKRMERDNIAASRTLFRSLLTEANHDPLLYEEINQYVQERGISPGAMTPEVVADLMTYIQGKYTRILSGKMPVDEIREKWIPLIDASIQAQKQAKPAESVSSAFWDIVTGRKKKKDVPQIDAALEHSVDQVSSDLIEKVDVTSLTLMQMDEKETRQTTGLIMRDHFNALITIFQKEKQVMADADRGWTSTFKTVMSYMYSGLQGAGTMGADTEAGFAKLSKALSKGHAPFMAQQFAYFEGIFLIGTAAMKAIILIIYNIISGVVNLMFYEEQIAFDHFNAIVPELTRLLATTGIEVITRSVSIFTGMFAIPLMILKLVLTWSPWNLLKMFISLPVKVLTGTVNWVSTMRPRKAALDADSTLKRDNDYYLQKAKEERRRLERKESIPKEKISFKITTCNTCMSNTAQWTCGHCNNRHYCCEGCATIDWHIDNHAYILTE